MRGKMQRAAWMLASATVIMVLVAAALHRNRRTTSALILEASELVAGSSNDVSKRSIPGLVRAESLFREILARDDLSDRDRAYSEFMLVMAIAGIDPGRIVQDVGGSVRMLIRAGGVSEVWAVLRVLKSQGAIDEIDMVLDEYERQAGPEAGADVNWLRRMFLGQRGTTGR